MNPAGSTTGRRAGRAIRGVLILIAGLGFAVAWWRYPAENQFSILRCTISFLGSPDADRNPAGWRFYQAGMTAVLLLLLELAWLRHVRLRGVIGNTARWSTGAVGVSLALMFLAVWIADTRDGRWFGMRTGELHTRMAVLAIPFMAVGVLLDGAALRRSGLPLRRLWPFPALGGVVLVGVAALVSWEIKCARDARLAHWPGESIHSTPLWEWISFTCLFAFMVWMAHGKWSPNPGGTAAETPRPNAPGPAPTPTPTAPRSRRRRWLTRAAQGLGLGIAIIALATLRPVDRAPWAVTAPAIQARTDAAAMHRELAAARPAALQTGWAAIPLDLRIGEPLAGYGARRGAGSQGIAEPLYGRALFLRAGETEAVLVTADVLLIHTTVAREIVRLCAAQGLAEKAIYFTATHTHCGPGGWGPNVIEQAVCGKFDPETVHRLARVLAATILQARAAAVPAEWSWLELSAPEYVRNRTVKGGPTDPSLDALAVRRLADGATGVFASYGAHATCHGSHQMKFSGDYPGTLVRSLERGGVKFAAFGAGAMGSQSPVGKGDDAARAEVIGTDLARLIHAALPGATWRRDVTLATARRDVPLPSLQVRLGRHVRLAGWIAHSLHPPTAPFHLLRLDEYRLAGLPVEFSAMLSAPLRAVAAQRGIHLCITPFNGDYAGYVLPPGSYDTSAYEAGMTFLGPWGGEYFVDLIDAGTGRDRSATATEP